MAVSGTFKVRVKYKNDNEKIKEVIPFGFETTLFVIVTDEDEVVPEKEINHYQQNKVVSTSILPSYVIPKGTFKGTEFLGANGEKYGESWVRNVIGKSMNEVFEKI